MWSGSRWWQEGRRGWGRHGGGTGGSERWGNYSLSWKRKCVCVLGPVPFSLSCYNIDLAMIQEPMLTSPSSVGKWARETESSVFLLMKQCKETEYYKEGREGTPLLWVSRQIQEPWNESWYLWLLRPHCSQAARSLIVRLIKISVRGGDLEIHIKQEEIEARRLATYPGSHANTLGQAGNSQHPAYPMTTGLHGRYHTGTFRTLRTGGFQPSNIPMICLSLCLEFPPPARQVFEQLMLSLQEPLSKNLLITIMPRESTMYGLSTSHARFLTLKIALLGKS